MPSAYCQTGYMEHTDLIYIPLTISNDDNSDFFSVIDVYNHLGQKLDSIEINPIQNKFYSIQALNAQDDTIFTCGLKGSCEDQSTFFIGYYSTSTSNHVEMTSFKNLVNSDGIKGMFKAGENRVGFFTSEDVYIYDYSIDSTYHVLNNLIEINAVSQFNDLILASSRSGLLQLQSQSLDNLDTLFKDQIRLTAIDHTDDQVYIASNFFVVRLNSNLSIADTLNLANGPMNISAPHHMYADANRLFMLDGNRVYTTDSNFSFVASDFTIGIRNSDTYVKNFSVYDNQVLVFGAKGNYFYSKSSHPWFLGSYGLSNSIPLNFDFQLVQVNVDSLYKFKYNGENFFKARFGYHLKNHSSFMSLDNFRANFYFTTKLCASSSSQQFHSNVNQAPGALAQYHSDWKTFGPIDNINDYISSNTRFNVSLTAFDETDYGSASFLNLTTNPFGFIGLEEHISDVNISPNPTNGIISVSGLNTNLDAFLLNSIGQILWSGELTESETEIDLSTFPQGAYYLHLSNEKDQLTKKILKL